MRGKIFLKKFFGFIIFEIFFMSFTMPVFIFYGPFTNIRDTLVTTAMTTFTHQYIVTTFLSKSTIEKIMKINRIDAGQSNMESINFKNNHNNSIDVYNVSGKHFDGKVILIHDPTRVEVGLSDKFPKEGETTSIIAKNKGAIAAINAGGFGDRSMKGIGGAPQGFVIHKGNLLYSEIQDNNKKVDLIGITKDGKLIVGNFIYKNIFKMGIKEAVSFGPPLVVNGKGMIKTGNGGWGIAPRTAIGQKSDGTIIFLVIDGRSLKSIGATLKDVQDIMLKYGAYNAANLDGGSSSTMYYEGKVINNPSDALGERYVPTIFFAK